MIYQRILASLILPAALLSAPGCESSNDDYGWQRPPADSLHPDDRGLQSKEVVEASDLMAQQLLSLPELNASDRRWTVVVTGVENLTYTQRNSLDIFLSRLKVNLAQYGRDRIQIVQNKDRYYGLRDRELDGGERDDFGQGPGGRGPTPVPTRIQPDFALSAVARDLPNRASDYYFFEFSLTDFRTGTEVWTGGYEVRVGN